MRRVLLAAPALLGLLAVPVAAAGERTRVSTVDDRMTGTGDNRFHYTGRWTSAAGDGYHRGTHSWSNQPGSSAEIRFTGTQIRLYGGTGPDAGVGRVSIDGGPAYEVDFHAPVHRGDVPLWTSEVLPSARHTFKLTVAGVSGNAAAGTHVVLDRVDIVAADTRRVGHERFAYRGRWKGGRSDTPGSTLTVSFTGAALNFYGVAGPRGGIGHVSVDGGPEERVDFHATSTVRNRLLWRSGPLRPAAHVFRLRAAAGPHGRRITAGHVEVVGHAETTPIPVVTTGTSTGWTKFARNPVLGKSHGTAFDTSILRENGVYRMWFSWRPHRAIAYAQSVDGVSWTAPRIVLPSVGGTWEEWVNRPSVSYNARLGVYQLWYTGIRDVAQVGYATSTDGLTWRRSPRNPVMSADATWENQMVLNPHVLWNPGLRRYQMWYAAGSGYEPKAIGYATSADGVTWVKSPRNPVLTANPAMAWERNRVSGPFVLRRPDGYYYMFYIGYAGAEHSAIGVARSRDGLSWSRMPTNPVVAPVAGSWECHADYKPSVLWDTAAGSWKLWYNGRCGAPEQQGLAVHRGPALGF
ncbi:hypothetical protein OIE66_01785 [Nonomuraea sp. NBC_01738]|uniref:hypothetical protein n=1 Tax=Nonomuraea sp. NBC_01738 TaxID=2976003 RepID=UPI002E0E1B1A|nr:hypothetical protein OIE66_01785 [Nonomuraea sp. NBC_01738]